ncbi:MAG: hypothetical protein FGM61_11605 [Sediminibacterium sp.]|nr:hypothetical protein [Sediminibacterium sp.]
MKRWICILSIGIVSSVNGQYYFNDIVANAQTHQQYKLLRAARVKKITGYSREAGLDTGGDVLFTQEVSMDGKRITLYSQEQNGKTSRTITYYNMGKLVKSESGNKNTQTTTQYTYHESGMPSRIQTTTRDTFLASTNTEIHEYFFKKDSTPDFAYIIRNTIDTIQVYFTTNEQKQVLDETWKRKHKEIEKYYFYYDNKKQLTDIVRFNSIANKLLPDFVYTYNEAGNISEMMQVPRSGNNYVVWKYTYNEKGLKLTDNCFSKNKTLLGSLAYVYEY